MEENSDIRALLLTLHSKVDVVSERVEHIREDVRDHAMRLNELEKSRWPVHLVSVLVAVGAFVMAILGKVQIGQ